MVNLCTEVLIFTDCRISDAMITTQSDKEEGFTGKSGFALVHQLTFTCSGMDGVNKNYDALRGDAPVWQVTSVFNEYVEPLQNTDKGLSVFATLTFADGIETIEFSMFKQSGVLSTLDTGDETITGKSTYPTIEFRGIVGDYPMLYKHVDDGRKIQGVSGSFNKVLVDIDVDLVSGGEVLRGFNYDNCRATDYVVSTNTNKDESYVKDKFALENIF